MMGNAKNKFSNIFGGYVANGFKDLVPIGYSFTTATSWGNLFGPISYTTKKALK